jgi:hypothetical protein
MSKEEKITAALACAMVVCLVAFAVLLYFLKIDNTKTTIIVDWNSPQFIGERSGQYSVIFGKTELHEEVPEDIKKEIEDEKAEYEIVHSNAELIRLYGISFKEDTLDELGIACNTKLFDMCNRYFLTTYAGQQLSPLVPMAISNIETPSRADNRITYCSLFPSKLIPIKSADAISNMSCLAVLETPELFSKLASDHWTRDRGALQMNPTYGTEYASFNSLMGPSEAEILSNIRNVGIDFSDYVAYEPRNNRNIIADDWLAEISSAPGDRFSVKDSVLRLAASAQGAVDQYSGQHVIENDMELMCLISMAHNAGSVWNPAYANQKIGNWRTGSVAYSYCKSLTSPEFTQLLKTYCVNKLEDARNRGAVPPMTLDRAYAKELFEAARKDGIVNDYRTYVYDTARYYEVTYCYPIQALYAYTMLGLVYSGR